MYTGKLVFAQVMEHMPIKVVRRCVQRYGGNHKIKSVSCLDQFLSTTFAQLTYRESLRETVICLRAQTKKFYHLGIRGGIARTKFQRFLINFNSLQNTPFVKSLLCRTNFSTFLKVQIKNYKNTSITFFVL